VYNVPLPKEEIPQPTTNKKATALTHPILRLSLPTQNINGHQGITRKHGKYGESGDGGDITEWAVEVVEEY